MVAAFQALKKDRNKLKMQSEHSFLKELPH